MRRNLININFRPKKFGNFRNGALFPGNIFRNGKEHTYVCFSVTPNEGDVALLNGKIDVKSISQTIS